MDPPLDFTNVLKIRIEPGPIARTEVLLENRKLTTDRIENARVLLSPGKPLLFACSIAEQALESHTWIDFCGKRLRGRRPGNGVRIRTTVTPITIAEVAGILNPELNG